MSTSFNNNFVGHILERPDLQAETSEGLIDFHGGALFCSLNYPSPCPGLRITNNIVAGSIFVGFTAPAHQCGNKDQVSFANNVAHSISGGKNGDAALVYKDPSDPEQNNCYEVSDFASYMCTDAGVLSSWPTKLMIFTRLVSVSNAIGAGAMVGS